MGNGPDPVGFARYYGLDTVVPQSVPDVIAVVRFVHNSRLHRAICRNRIQNRFRHGGIILLAGCQHDHQGRIFVGCRQMDFGAEAAFAST